MMVMGTRMISITIVLIAILAAASPLAAATSTTTAMAWRSSGAPDLAAVCAGMQLKWR